MRTSTRSPARNVFPDTSQMAEEFPQDDFYKEVNEDAEMMDIAQAMV